MLKFDKKSQKLKSLNMQIFYDFTIKVDCNLISYLYQNSCAYLLKLEQIFQFSNF